MNGSQIILLLTDGIYWSSVVGTLLALAVTVLCHSTNRRPNLFLLWVVMAMSTALLDSGFLVLEGRYFSLEEFDPLQLFAYGEWVLLRWGVWSLYPTLLTSLSCRSIAGDGTVPPGISTRQIP